MENIKNLKIYKKALIVIDMVNGFVNEGVLHDKTIGLVINRQKELIDAYLKEGELVIFIKDTHTKESREFKRFGNTNHCLEHTSEAELVPELKVYENQDNVISIEKNSTSFMEAPKFRNVISELTNLKEVDVVGCCTDICVANGSIGLANYFDQWNKDVEIRVHEDAIETYHSDFHNRDTYADAAKLLMKQQGIQLVKKKNI